MDALAAQFPCFLPDDETLTSYSGIISVLDRDFRLRVTTKNGPQRLQSDSLTLECDWELQQLIRDVRPAIKKRLDNSGSLYEFMVELVDTVERLVKAQGKQSNGSNPAYIVRLMEDLEILGWDKITYVDPALSMLQLEISDTKKRVHSIMLQIPTDYPNSAPFCQCALPGSGFMPKWTSNSSLEKLMGQYQEVLNEYQDIWDMLDEIDSETWVLEPENPARNMMFRRIAVAKNCSLHIELDPLRPRMLPEFRFMGSDAAIAPIRAQLNSRISEWNSELSLLQNIRNVIQVELPSPMNSKKEEFSAECGICYAYRIGDAIPDKTCNDTRCRQQFHQECLVEWLRALPNCRQSFNVLFGECPYCSKPMTVKLGTK